MPVTFSSSLRSLNVEICPTHLKNIQFIIIQKQREAARLRIKDDKTIRCSLLDYSDDETIFKTVGDVVLIVSFVKCFLIFYFL